MAGTFAQAELPLQQAKRAFDGSPGEVDLPHAPGAWVDAVHHQVEMRMIAVVVGNHDPLVLRKPEIHQQPVSDANHEVAVHPVVEVETDREMVDGGRRAGSRSHQGHHRGGVMDGRRPDVTRVGPVDAPVPGAVPAVLQIVGQLLEAATERLVPDHRSLTTLRIARSASVAASASA